MKRRAARLFGALTIASSSLVACATGHSQIHFAHFSLVSKAPERRIAEVTTPVLAGGPVVGSSCHYSLLFVPLNRSSSPEEAIRDAIAKAPGATALANAALKNDAADFFLFTKDCFEATGTGVTLKE